MWLVILALLGSMLWLNQVGLPGIVKRPLLEKLRARGLDLQFSRLRVRWYQGIVADDVRFGQPDEPLSPRLTLAEVQVRLNWRALTRLQLQVDSVMLRQGRLLLPLASTNQPVRELAVENIHSELRFLPNDQWMLENFTAGFAGANLRLNGVVTNASAVQNWSIFTGEPAVPPPAGVWQRRLSRLADTLERIHFSAPPEVRLDVRGDARDLQSFNVLMLLSAPGADTPWGTVSQGRFAGRLFPAGTNGVSRAEISLDAADALTRWASITNFALGIRLASPVGLTNPVTGDLRLYAARVQTKWASGSNALFIAHWLHAMTNPVPISGRGLLRCDFARADWANASGIRLAVDLKEAALTDPQAGDPARAWWTNLAPYAFSWDCDVRELRSPKFEAGALVAGGTWRAPRLTVTNLEAQLYGGQLAAQGGLDVGSRVANARVASDFDLHRIAPVLGSGGQRWLDQFAWEAPPRLKGEVSVTLPPWTARPPGWQAEFQRSLQVQGEFDLARGGVYREVQVTTARSHFRYTNQCWDLPDLTFTRPEGGVAAVHHADGRTREFYWRISSTVDPRCLRPLLDESQRGAFDLFSLTQPPVVQAEIWGRANEPGSVGLKARVALTNFAFRGEQFTGLQTALQYTNQVLQLFEPQLQCDDRQARADGLAADFKARFVYLTNGFSTTEPMMVARAIGAHIAHAIEPYRFTRPPTARVYGVIPMKGDEGADLHFDLAGGPFHWWKFKVPQISGHVHWAGERLTLTNVNVDFYQGLGAGSARFDFQARRGADFQFVFAITNTRLQGLMADLSTRTNHLEGRLSGNLVVASANTEDWRTVGGYGEMELRDGLIWDIPMFGIFSPVLNGLSPGLGNSRASAATCSFVITNGVILSDDLEIRSTAMRLQYRGTVDLEGRLNARVEAGLLRDMWLVGPLVSTVLWPVTKMFEYKVTGTLDVPQSEPVFIIPKIVLLPFHPLRTLKSLRPEPPAPASTNAPSATQ